MTTSPVWRDLYGMTQDGVRLHMRDYGDAKSTLTPIVCLPGLTRNAADFDDLARALTRNTGRRVLVLESRGRGGSEWAKKPEDYSIPVEVGDLIHMLDIFAIKRAVFVGTSRGGLLTMVLAAMRPDLIAASVLNDIGPVIEPAGLLRIKSYVGKSVLLPDFTVATAALSRSHGPFFPALSTDDWDVFARGTWSAGEGGLSLSYDPAISSTLKDYDPEAPAPDLWPFWEALAVKPCLIIRGELSDLFTDGTAQKMAQGKSHCAIHVVPGQGHAPLLRDQPTMQAIAGFIETGDAA